MLARSVTSAPHPLIIALQSLERGERRWVASREGVIFADGVEPTKEEIKATEVFLPIAVKLDGENYNHPDSLTNLALSKIHSSFLSTHCDPIMNSIQKSYLNRLSNAVVENNNRFLTIEDHRIDFFRKSGHLSHFSDLELKTALSYIKVARALDEKYVGKDGSYLPNSLTNKIYQALYPREYGVIVYGGSLKGENADEYLKHARRFARDLCNEGYFVVTGGGHSFMEAIALGALDAGSHTVGSNLWRFNDSDPKVHREIIMHQGVPSRISGVGGYEYRGTYAVCWSGGIGTKRELKGRIEDLLYGVSPYESFNAIAVVERDPVFIKEVKAELEGMIASGRAKPKVFEMIKFVKTGKQAAKLFKTQNIGFSGGRELDHTLI